MSSHAIEIDIESCSYDRETVLSDVRLQVPPGQFVGMIGPSGAGKSTVLKAAVGLVPQVRGRVTIAGRAVTPGRSAEVVGYVPQVETVDWHFPVTVQDVVLMGRVAKMGLLPWPSKDDKRAVAAVLERLGIGDLARRHIRDLSGGQQQRTFLARALIGEPRVLLLDEPTASVDIKTRDEILHQLVALNKDGVTILMTTHEVNTVAAHLPWVVCINRGIVAQGHPRDVFTNDILSRTFNTTMRVVSDTETGGLLVAEAGNHGPFAAAQRPLGVSSNQAPALSGAGSGGRS